MHLKTCSQTMEFITKNKNNVYWKSGMVLDPTVFKYVYVMYGTGILLQIRDLHITSGKTP